MRLSSIAAEAFAVAAIYLIITIPLASATSISVMFQNSPVAQIQLPEHVSISASVSDGTASVTLSKAGKYVPQKVYMYHCREIDDPVECLNSQTVESHLYFFESDSLNIQVPWDDIRGPTHKANMLFMVRTAVTEGSTWIGYWATLERVGTTYPLTINSLDNVQLHVDDPSKATLLNQLIGIRGGIPFMVTKAVLSGASKLYEMGTDDPPAVTTAETAGNEVSSMGGKKYLVAFPEDSNARIMTGIPFIMPPQTNCGNQNCEIGETKDNCCSDCGCAEGFYCNVELPNRADGSCKALSSVGLSLDVAPSMRFISCQVSNNVQNVIFSITNQPSSMSLSSASFRLNSGGLNGPMTCVKVSGKYMCSFTIPSISGCTGSMTISGNDATFRISFPDGHTMKAWSVTAALPDIIIAPPTCGNQIIDPGETGCCADMGCPAGYICNIEGSGPSGWTCRPEPVAVISVGGPFQFTPHDSDNGDEVEVGIRVTNPPPDLSYVPDACSIVSCDSEAGACSASCSASCEEAATSMPGTKEYDCKVWFKLSPYDSNLGYTASFDASYSFSYSNGFYKNSLKKAERVTVGSGRSFYGDGVCTSDESSVNHCWDCVCPDGFCKTGNFPDSNTDVCVPTSALYPVIEGLPAATETRPNDQISLGLDVSFPNAPEGINVLYASCSNQEGVQCSMQCAPMGPRKYACKMTIAPMGEYRSMPTFDSVTNVATLHNTIDFEVSVNDGSRGSKVMPLSKQAEMDVKFLSTCGNSICETWLDEDCCIDCGCQEGEICLPGGSNTLSQCRPESDVTLIVKKAPDEAECTISNAYLDSCRFSEALEIKVKLANAPENVYITDKSYTLDGEEGGLLSCTEDKNDEGAYNCRLMMDPVSGGPGTTQHALVLRFGLYYYEAGKSEQMSLEVSHPLDITRKYSEGILSCLDAREKYDSDMDDLERDEMTLQIVYWTFVGVSTALGTAAAVVALFNAVYAEYLLYMAAIFSGLACLIVEPYLLGELQKVRSEMVELEMGIQSLCNSLSAPDMGRIEDLMEEQMDKYILEIVGEVWTCIIFAVTGFIAMSSITVTGYGAAEAAEMYQAVDTAWSVWDAYEDVEGARTAYNDYRDTKEELREMELDLTFRTPEEQEAAYGHDFGDYDGTVPAEPV